jgi:Transglycosylase SLT domain
MGNRSASWENLRRGWVVALIVVTVAVAALIPAGRAGAATSRGAASGLAAIPVSYLTWYKEAARTCRGLAWEVLAAIGTMESDNGRSPARGVHHGKNRKGAEGPMQFEPATFAEYAVRADRSRKLSPYDPEDAIFSAARMLCSDGGGRARGLKGAIFAYNHARWYVRDVLALAARYTAAARAGHHQRAGHPRRR